jgi:hypothetical protein
MLALLVFAWPVMLPYLALRTRARRQQESQLN